MEREQYIISSVQKALKVLKLFDAQHKDMTLTEISNMADMRKGTMLRVLTTLEEEGFIQYDDKSKRYRLGIALYMLSVEAFQFNDMVKIARPLLEKVTVRLSLTAHVAMLDGDNIILVDRVLPNNIFNVYDLKSTVGGIIEPHCTGVGKVITAFSEDRIKEKLIEKCSFEKKSENTVVSKEKFFIELQKVRERGYGVNEGENEEYLKCITYPVFNYKNNIIGAISLTGIKQQFTDILEKEVHKELKEICMKVSKQMGYKL